MPLGIIEHYRSYLTEALPPSYPVVSLGEGNTPLVPARLPSGRPIHLKFEGQNPTGSFKDRGMTVAVSGALGDGARAVICASTGNTAAAAAAYAVRAGLRCYVMIPDGQIAQGKLGQALAAGARVLAVQGNFDVALRLVRQLVEDHADISLVNSVNPRRLEGQKTAAFEVVEELGDGPALLAIPVGNAGNITAYHRGFGEYLRLGKAHRIPQLLGVQAEGAAPMVLGHDVDAPNTIASAIKIGHPASRHLAQQAVAESRGRFLAVSDEEILSAYRYVARRIGVFAEPSSCTSVAGLIKAEAMGLLPEDGPVVAVLTGHGLKDPHTAISVAEPARVIPPTREALEEEILVPV